MADFGSTVKNLWMKSMEAIGNTATNIAANTKYKVDEMNMVNRRSEILADFGSKAYALWQKGEHFPAELEEQLIELKKLDEKLNDMRAERYAGVKNENGEATDDPAEAADEVMDEAAEAVGAEAEKIAEEVAEAAEEAADAVAQAAEEADDTIREKARIIVETAEEAAAAAADGASDAAESAAHAAEEITDSAQSTAESIAQEATKAADAMKTAAAAAQQVQNSVPVIEVESSDSETEKKAAPLSDPINDLFEKIPSREEMESKVNSALDSLGQSLQKFSREIDEGLSSLTDNIDKDQK